MTLQPAEVLFPDAEMWLTGALRAAFATRSESYKSGVVVSTSIPATFTRLVQVRRDGGTERGVFDRPRFGINVYAATEKDVADLARLAAALVRLLPGDGVCTHMTVTGPSPIPDSKPRRYFTAEANLRGEPL